MTKLRKALEPEMPQSREKVTLDLTGRRVVILRGPYAGEEGFCLGRTAKGSRWAISPDASAEILQLAFVRGFRLLSNRAEGGKKG